MTQRGQKKLALAAIVLPVVMAVSMWLAPVQAASGEEGCWFEDQYTQHGACATNDCWFWQPGQRCKNGAWVGACGCDPIASN